MIITTDKSSNEKADDLAAGSLNTQQDREITIEEARDNQRLCNGQSLQPTLKGLLLLHVLAA